jgi:Cytochrome P450
MCTLSRPSRAKGHSTIMFSGLHVFHRISLTPRTNPHANLLMSSDKTRHAILRRTIGPTLSGSAMTQFEPTLKRYDERFLKKLEKAAEENNGVVDMNDWFNRLSFDVISFWKYLTRSGYGSRHIWAGISVIRGRRGSSMCGRSAEINLPGPSSIFSPLLNRRMTYSSSSSLGWLNSSCYSLQPKS